MNQALRLSSSRLIRDVYNDERSALYTSRKFLLDQLLMLNKPDGWWPVVGAINQVLRLSSSRLIRDVYNAECPALI
jgi:hypothetical protein